ncbi:MAG: acyltransferase domain-containing protein [Capsulimonadales bacterium]|nr:acyltransferase domain-containing protein [Capsulimonadales bacterium]
MWLPEAKAVPALREWSGLPAEEEAALAALVARVRKDKKLAALCEQGADLLYERNAEGGYDDLSGWQPPAEEEPAFCLLIALAALPSVRVAHALRKVDESITRATCRDIGTAVARWKSVHGTVDRPLGIDRSLLPWFRLLASGELYRLGALEFVRGTFPGEVLAFRHRQTGELTALAAHGAAYDAAGYRTETDAPGALTAEVREDAEAVSGCGISDRGLATQETRTLLRSEWEPFLQAGDPILEIHLPDGELPEEPAFRESSDLARSFFSAHYGGQPVPKAFVCVSRWLDPAREKGVGAGLRYPTPPERGEGIREFRWDSPEGETPLRPTGMLIPFGVPGA